MSVPKGAWIPELAKGQWWLPHDESQKVPGVLTEKNGRFRLELIGTFDESNLNFEAARYPVVCGFLAQGGPVTLFSCVGTKSLSIPGMMTEQCSFSIAIKGHNFHDAADVFDSLTCLHMSLLTWLNRSGFDIEVMRIENAQHYEWRAAYRQPELITWKWSDDLDFVVRFSVEGLPSGVHANKPITMRQVCSVEAVSALPKTIVALHQAQYGLSLLISLLSGFSSQMTLVACGSSLVVANGRRKQLELQLDRIDTNEDRESAALDWHKALVPYPEVESEFADLVPRWKQLLEEQGEVIDAYFASRGAAHLEEQLVGGANALQRLEETSKGRRLAFEVAVSEPINRYVPATVAAWVIPLLTKTRHYFTHFNPAERADAARGAQLANLVDLVDAIVVCKLLELLGFDAQKVKTFLDKNENFRKRLMMNRWTDQ